MAPAGTASRRDFGPGAGLLQDKLPAGERPHPHRDTWDAPGQAWWISNCL